MASTVSKIDSFNMVAYASLIIAIFAGISLGNPLSRSSAERKCGTPVRSQEQAAAAESKFTGLRRPFSADSFAPINVTFHVIYKDETLEGGYLGYVFDTLKLPFSNL